MGRSGPLLDCTMLFSMVSFSCIPKTPLKFLEIAITFPRLCPLQLPRAKLLGVSPMNRLNVQYTFDRAFGLWSLGSEKIRVHATTSKDD